MTRAALVGVAGAVLGVALLVTQALVGLNYLQEGADHWSLRVARDAGILLALGGVAVLAASAIAVSVRVSSRGARR